MPRLSTTTIAIAACLGAWSPASHACTSDPVISSICIMSLNPTGQFAAFNQYTALFSLLGTTYGGNGSTTFNLPDLRGKVIVGFDARDGTRPTGTAGGSATINLSVAQLPQHAMTVTNLPVTLSNVQAVTTLSGLTATANLGGAVIRGQPTGLTMKAVTGANGQGTPANNYLGKAVSGTSADPIVRSPICALVATAFLLVVVPVQAKAARHDLVQAGRALAVQDYPRAWQAYRRHAASNALAQFHLGLFEQQGWGRPANPVAACAWFDKAAHGGIPAAQQFLGDCLAAGIGRPVDGPGALQWYRAAASSGIAWAGCAAGQLHLAGQIVQPSRSALAVNRIADINSTRFDGRLHANGRSG
jgi:microcystin-dependent protein